MGRNDNLPGLLPFFDLFEKQVTAFLPHLIGLMGNGCQGRFHIVGVKLVGVSDQGNIGRDTELVFFDLFMAAKASVSFIARIASGGSDNESNRLHPSRPSS